MHNYRKCSSRLACTGARVLLASACLLVLAGCGAEGPRPNVVLITVDTLRSDILAPYSVAASPGNAVGRAVVDVANTPHLSELASSATLFERATAPMSLTRPSHFSIFTGRYPREHGVVNNQIALRAAEETVTELFRDEGYHTGAFVAVSLLGEGSGALQGFDTVAGPSNQLEWAAPRVIDHARKWLQSLPEDEPYFLWVHLFDPHQPYNPPAQERVGLDAELAADYPSIGWGELLEIAKANGGHISQEVLDYSKALYRAEVQAVDASVGLLIETVDSLAAPERTMVVFTADHGECFENGNYFEHSDCLYEGGVRVPLIVRYPAEFAAGERVSSLVSNGDIAPTLLRAAGISVPTTMTSLALQADGRSDDRYVLLQNPFYQPGVLPGRMHRQVVIRRVGGEPVATFDPAVQKVGVVKGGWKYLRSEKGDELFKAGVVPGSEKNVAHLEHSVREEMGELLDRALVDHPLTILAPDDVNAELMQSLRALGYVE